MGSLIGPWDSSSEDLPRAPPTRRWSDAGRPMNPLEQQREEQRHREARTRLSAAAAAKAEKEVERASGRSEASSDSIRRPSTGTKADPHRGRPQANTTATEDLLREMRLGGWQRILASARDSIEPELDTSMLSVDHAVISGVAAAANLDSGEEEDEERQPRKRKTLLAALALERREPRGTGTSVPKPNDSSAPHTTRSHRTQHVRVHLEVLDDEIEVKEEVEEEKLEPEKDVASFVRVVEEARRRRTAADTLAANPTRASGWWDRTESAHMNRNVREV